jgi:hypothetical protein
MFTPDQFRAKAIEYAASAKTANSPTEMQEYEELERSFTVLADNEQWLADNHDKTVHAKEHRGAETLAEEEEHVLRCLGAALIMQWNALPTRLQRELFDNAGSMGQLLETAALRGQIARFLHKHKDEENHRVSEAVEAPESPA